MMKRFLFLACSLLLSAIAIADEGMWLLPYIDEMNADQMRERGLKISTEDIFNPQGVSIKDAVVMFGNGCSGVVVSPDGLVLTNHHCGFGSIQALSSVDKDYITDGYWAADRRGELPVPNLSVRFVRDIEEVTDRVIGNIPDIADEVERRKMVNDNIKDLRAELEKRYVGKDISVSSFFGGNRYFAFVTDVYNDIRLVAAPPQSIGTFGGDTDNWVWPRHTGDFSVFRVYAAPDGVTPAVYSPDNVPYRAPEHITVSRDGYDEGDYAMIIGFPGSTNRYMTSYELEQLTSSTNANRITVRSEYLAILKRFMDEDDGIRIKYASKYSSSSNYWKNAIGMNEAIAKNGVKAAKEALQNDFTTWVNKDPLRREKYGDVLKQIENSIALSAPISSQMQIYSEALFRTSDLFDMVSSIAPFANNPRQNVLDRHVAALNDAYDDYDADVDRAVLSSMLKLVSGMIAADNLPDVFEHDIKTMFDGDIDAYTDYVFKESVFADREKAIAFLNDFDSRKYDNDPAVRLYNSVNKRYASLRVSNNEMTASLAGARRLFIDGIVKMNPHGNIYPDANSTIRLTYGNILPYNHSDAVKYDYFTTSQGVIEKEDAQNDEFMVPSKLKRLILDRDFGTYADKDGSLHVAFVSNNDITGGNSGSPVFNARGELIGLAFDGNWEALSGDVNFEPVMQRSINVDVRYIMFLIDKFGGAGWIVDEMTES